MTSYTKGRHFEYRVRDYLKSLGYFVVRQAKSAFPDLIAINEKSVIVIECKVNGRLSKDEIEKMEYLNNMYGVEIYMAYREKNKMKFKNMITNKEWIA